MPDAQTSPESPKTIVGMAASAGGLEAATALIQNLPDELDCCYVIAQHMSPSHKNMLAQILARETKLDVVDVESETAPVKNTIYIPPSAHDIVFEGGKLRLKEPSGHPAAPKPSGDRLFKSLADEFGERAIGIVLSGTGSDGSYGIRAIRERGGITIAQDPSTSKYDGMPEAAIRTGCVDLTLTPQQIGTHITEIMKHPRDLSALQLLNDNDHGSQSLFDILISHTQVDFRHYKENTRNRRIQRRMIAKGIEDFDQYVQLCRESKEEVFALFQDLLISVTRFFRDPDQFLALREILEEKISTWPEGVPFRIWVPGCATGEEAYSLAILVCEAFGGLENVVPESIQIFATDIDEDALNVGRRGVYPIAALSDIPEGLAEKYFGFREDTISAKPKLRSLVLFSRHNVFHDAPFTKIDLVSIRNLLIYFKARLQERVLTRMTFALNPNGLLFLGTSESLGHLESGFWAASNSARIYRKRHPSKNLDLGSLSMRTLLPDAELREEPRAFTNAIADDWRQFDRLAKAIVKNGLLVNRSRAILRVYGDIAPYSALTEYSFGQSTLSILKPQLAADAASLALVALKQREARSGQWHEIAGMKKNIVIQLTAYPMHADQDIAGDLVLIGITSETRSAPEIGSSEKSEYVTHLEDELGRIRAALQVSIEQLQTSNEELQSSNEELQSSNEELQSTNEELETSNEELQSTNEELITVNEELLVKGAQLERKSAELNGLIGKLPIPLLMVDQGLNVRYASQKAINVFHLQELETGYGHLSQSQLPEGFPPLISLCNRALMHGENWNDLVNLDGSPHELRITTVESAQGQLIGLVVQLLSAPSSLKASSAPK